MFNFERNKNEFLIPAFIFASFITSGPAPAKQAAVNPSSKHPIKGAIKSDATTTHTQGTNVGKKLWAKVCLI